MYAWENNTDAGARKGYLQLVGASGVLTCDSAKTNI
jgi:hypothetical protein